MHNRNETQPACHTQPVKSEQLTSLSCVSDRFRGPEFCLGRVQLLAADAVTMVTRPVSGGRDEQHKHSAVGCFGGGKQEDREVISESHIQNNHISVGSSDIFTSVCVCSMC